MKDIDKLSRWIRCLFSLALVSKLEMAEHLLDQVVTITREGLAVGGKFSSAMFQLPIQISTALTFGLIF